MSASKFASSFPTHPDACVRLNVGGVEYTTLVKTLTGKSKYFKNLAKPNGPSVPKVSEDGSFFIDRDGTSFGTLLSYMRTGEFSHATNNLLNLVRASR